MTDTFWRADLSEAEQQEIRALIAAADAEDGVAPVGEQVLRALSKPGRHLVAVDSARLVGYLNLVPEPPMAESVVDPAARRRGIGSALLTEGLRAGGSATRVWAHGNLEPARAVARSLGLVVARELWQMRRSLLDLPALREVPDSIVVRTYAGPDDDAELLRVNNAAFAWHPEQGGWTAADLAERRDEAWFDPAGLFLAVDAASGKLLGFHWTKVHTSPRIGEVYVLGVDPDSHGRGVGSMLTLIGLHHLADVLVDHPDPTVLLYTEADNAAAVRTYERLGFEVFAVDTAYSA